MAKISNSTVLLLHVFYIMVQDITVFGLINCSEYFTDMTKSGITNLLGRIEILPPPINDDYYLKVTLNTYDTNEVTRKNSIRISRDFRIELTRTKYESIRAVHKSEPLLYHIYYPSHKSIPTVTAIWFNNQQYCPGIESNGNINATIELGHIVYSPSKDPFYSTWNDDRNSSSYSINNPSHDRLNYLNTENIIATLVEFANNECGITNYYTDDTNRLYPNGQEIFPGQWPWLVALFEKKNYVFKCGGSLLTTRHVITAGHCLKEDSSNDHNIHPNCLLVALGQYYLQYYTNGTINQEVANYTIHPDYAHDSSGDSDLAILILKKSVEYTPFIKPICLWYSSSNLQNVINKRGYVVGWGYGRNNFVSSTNYPRMIKVPIVSQETCLRSDQRFLTLTSDRTFCAGGQKENGPCNGDSGSGLMIFDDTTGRYHLRGIVSRALFIEPGHICDIESYSVYVDITKYKLWIQQQIFAT